VSTPAGPVGAAGRGYLGRVRPASFPVTSSTIAELLTDYDLELAWAWQLNRG